MSLHFDKPKTDYRTPAARRTAPAGPRTVTRISLIEAVYNCCPTLSRAEARRTLDAVLEEITETLVRGEAVHLRSFGSFKVRSKRARVGRNPKTGEEAPITPRRVLTFKASSLLVSQMNEGKGQPRD